MDRSTGEPDTGNSSPPGRQTAPPHLVEVLGEVPPADTAERDRWASLAGRIEAYREEWGVNPNNSGSDPMTIYSKSQWPALRSSIDVSRRLQNVTLYQPLDRSIDAGHGVEL